MNNPLLWRPRTGSTMASATILHDEPLGGLVAREGTDHGEEREVIGVVKDERTVIGTW